MLDQTQVDRGAELAGRIVENVETVVFGKGDVVRLVVGAMVAGGHVLLEDVPGTGKTSLVSALARSVDCSFRRIQFTPDVMPSDITGFSVFNQKTREFEFRPGSVDANIVLADEVNRASAKTQSALLEAMEERQVTVDGVTRPLPDPFMVLATENPVEQYGTYPLPEAQVDRFLVKLSVGYPDFRQEVRILQRPADARDRLAAVASARDVAWLRDAARQVTAAQDVCSYIVQLVDATRTSSEVTLGSSPRGGLATLAMSRARALMDGRGYVTPDDVKAVAPHTLAHRIILSSEARAQGRGALDVIASIIAGVAVPVTDAGGERA
ncbi:MoxR family ATPase [bacterium]|nr:MoxR family ATPase [bacterium]